MSQTFFNQLTDLNDAKDAVKDYIFVNRWQGVGAPNFANAAGWETTQVNVDQYFSANASVFKFGHYTPVSLSGSTSETILCAISIPAGSAQVGSIISLNIHLHHRNNANCNLRVYCNNTPDLVGSPILLNRDSKTGNNSNRMYDLRYVVSSAGTCVGLSQMDSVDTNNLTNCKFGSSAEYVNIDWTASHYIVITGQNNSNGNDITLNAAAITIV